MQNSILKMNQMKNIWMTQCIEEQKNRKGSTAGNME